MLHYNMVGKRKGNPVYIKRRHTCKRQRERVRRLTCFIKPTLTVIDPVT
jgi:hypothetical protein